MKLKELGYLYNYSYQNFAIFMLIVIIIALFITNKLLFLFHDNVHGEQVLRLLKAKKIVIVQKTNYRYCFALYHSPSIFNCNGGCEQIFPL